LAPQEEQVALDPLGLAWPMPRRVPSRLQQPTLFQARHESFQILVRELRIEAGFRALADHFNGSLAIKLLGNEVFRLAQAEKLSPDRVFYDKNPVFGRSL